MNYTASLAPYPPATTAAQTTTGHTATGHTAVRNEPGPASQVFRCINPRGYLLAPLGAGAGFRYSPAFGLGALLLIGVTLAVLSQLGSEFTAEGVVVRRLLSRRLVPWSSMRSFRTTVSRNAGTRIELVSSDGATVRLSAPTSETGGLEDATGRLVTELSHR